MAGLRRESAATAPRADIVRAWLPHPLGCSAAGRNPTAAGRAEPIAGTVVETAVALHGSHL